MKDFANVYLLEKQIYGQMANHRKRMILCRKRVDSPRIIQTITT
jgi:hypothetical protein